MSRLIDADKLIELIDDDIAAHKDGYFEDFELPPTAYGSLCALRMVREYIEALPTVEVVPLEDYRSMEQTVYKLTQALAEAEPTKHYNTESYKMTVTDFPPVEYAPIKHGHWIVISEYPKKAECSHCGYPIEHELVCWWDYCPNCGAKMFDKDIDVSDKSVGKMDEVEE